ncbi:MAG: transglycosylase SLT domain-containing protein [Deltaproteobacteria bacterium]|nr:transglycosylase SLT domain-containing protein [Deltaproteobacteria bacterium]
MKRTFIIFVILCALLPFTGWAEAFACEGEDPQALDSYFFQTPSTREADGTPTPGAVPADMAPAEPGQGEMASPMTPTTGTPSLTAIQPSLTVQRATPGAAPADMAPAEPGQGDIAASMISTGEERKVPTFDVPVVINPAVENHIEYFQTRGRKVFLKWLERSEMYLSMIKETLSAAGLPEDLAYIGLIESGYNPYARSRAKAVGIWQFIPGTAKKYGLRVNWWVDERRNPEKATLAAANYLKNLYGMFDSWYLAAAGYNAGEGKVSRAIKKYNTEDFWELASHKKSLKSETKNYIPKYMAAMLIAKDPQSYGFTEINYMEPLAFEKVTVPGPTDLKVIAWAAGTTVEDITMLNPELLRWFTPPDYPDYQINIPAGKKEIFEERMSRVPRQERLRFHQHKLRKGETLSQIARLYGTDIKQIMYLNDIKSTRGVRAGRMVVVPVRAKDGVDAHEVVKARYTPSPEETYTVREGDSLWLISRRFGIGLDRLRQLNDLGAAERLLMPGQTILLKEALLDKPENTKGLN